MSKTREGIMKQASASIRTLVSQLEGFEKVAEQNKIAREVMEKLLADGRVSTEDFLDKLAELEAHDLDEIILINKALDFGTFDGQFKLAEISDEVSLEGLDPSDKFLRGTINL